MKDCLLDANVLVRFFTQDPPAMGDAARRFFEAAERGERILHLPTVIVAEAVFVLTKVYRQDRATVANALIDLIENPGFTIPDALVLRDALDRFRSAPVDFADALLAALAAREKFPIASFDRDLDRFTDISRIEPP